MAQRSTVSPSTCPNPAVALTWSPAIDSVGVPSIAITWGLATDNVAASRYQILLTNQSGATLYNLGVNHPGTSYTLATSSLVDGDSYTLQVPASTILDPAV
jgi:hypothetical protein